MNNTTAKLPKLTGKKKTSIFKAATAALLLASMFLLPACNNSKPVSSVKAPSGAAYNMEQQIFTLCMLSNVSGGFNGRAGDTILDSTIWAVDTILADPGFQSLAGNWKCVWGPAVMKHKTYNKAINTMFIAQNVDSPSVFVVAIAGTNFTSVDDWVAEDFDIATIKYWDSIVANIYDTAVFAKPQKVTNPFVSRATYRGLFNLASLTDKVTNTTALAFLKSVGDTAKGKINIWTTGHSLGGALSPTLALYLNDTKATWCPNDSNNVSINCLAVAGATPGDISFSRRYYKELGSNTIRIWNHNDPVPHGFQANILVLNNDMLDQVDSIFKPDGIPTPAVLDSIIGGVRVVAANYVYTQLYPSRDTEFTASWYGVNDTFPGGTHLGDPGTFLGQLVCQHIPSYPAFFGVSAVQTRMQQVLGHNSPFFSGGYITKPVVSTSVVPTPEYIKFLNK